MPMRIRATMLPTLMATCAIAAFSLAGPARAEAVNVVSTIGMIGDVVVNVGGDCVESTSLMGPGVDPHLYQATARDVRTFQTADIILYSGYSLEGQLGEVLGKMSERVPTLAVSPAAIEPAELISVKDLYGIDPHLWMDAALWSKIVPVVADNLRTLAPDCADRIDANAEEYGLQLAALDDWVRASIATIPEAQRILVTAHDAFNYYGRSYSIEVAGIQGISTESEAGVADIRDMATVVAERQVPAVFIESTINPRTIQAVIDAAAQQGHTVEIGAELFSDAMGEAGTAGGTYIGMIYNNTFNITEALGGTPPPLPETLSRWAAEWELAAAAN